MFPYGVLDGMIRHPLLRDVTIVLALKVVALTAIYFALVAPARTKVALTRTALGALRSIQKQLDRVESCFGHKDVAYAA